VGLSSDRDGCSDRRHALQVVLIFVLLLLNESVIVSERLVVLRLTPNFEGVSALALRGELGEPEPRTHVRMRCLILSTRELAQHA